VPRGWISRDPEAEGRGKRSASSKSAQVRGNVVREGKELCLSLEMEGREPVGQGRAPRPRRRQRRLGC
jgi:hypothetical protein